MIAENELYIAKYYSKRSAHVAAIERVKYMLKNYSGTPSSEEGLLVMINSYNNLKMKDLAYDTSRVLKENYPEYTIIETKNNFIKAYKENKPLEIDTKDKSIQENGTWFSYFNIFNYF
jgi:outer membrane protein assembly factor BamD